MINVNLLIEYGAIVKVYSIHEVIFNKGDNAHFYFQLLSGSVKWLNVNNEGTEYIHEIITDGQCFGEMPLFDNKPYAASAITEKESTILKLNITSFNRLLKENNEILFYFIRVMSHRLQYKFLISKERALYNPEHIIISLLDYYKKNDIHFCNKYNQLNLTRQQLAGLTGMRVETVIRSIRSLEKQGKLKIKKGHVFYDL